MKACWVGLLIGLGSLAQAKAAVTVVEAGAYSYGYAFASDGVGSKYREFGDPPDPKIKYHLNKSGDLSVTDKGSDKVSSNGAGYDTEATDSESTSLSLTGATSGAVSFAASTSETVTPTGGKIPKSSIGPYTNAYNFGSAYYEFDSTGAVVITLISYNTTTVYGFQGYVISINGNVIEDIDSGTNSSGPMSFLVGPGGGSIEIDDDQSDETYAYMGSYGATTTGTFNFTVSAVPEPSTWGLMAFGFVGLGFAGYLRSKGITAVASGA